VNSSVDCSTFCTRKRENRKQHSLVKVSCDKQGSLLGDGWPGKAKIRRSSSCHHPQEAHKVVGNLTVGIGCY
jgi:hypothetical protein